MPRPNSRKSRALLELERAHSSLGKALSLLGGKPRGGAKALPFPTQFIARQYLVSLLNRNSVVIQLLTNGLTAEREVQLRDKFEREYDTERKELVNDT